jgi:hypothetical protein
MFALDRCPLGSGREFGHLWSSGPRVMIIGRMPIIQSWRAVANVA